MEAIFVEDILSLEKARDELMQAPVWGCDVETTGFDAHTEELRLLQIAPHAEKAYVFNMRELNDPTDFTWVKDYFANKRPTLWQNAKFDLQFMTHWFGEGPLPIEGTYDTMLASKILACGIQMGHGLKDIALRETRRSLDKTLQKSDFGATDLSEEQLLYAANDSTILHEIRDRQKPRLENQQLDWVTRIECDAVAAIADIELNGFYLDAEEWAERCTDEGMRRQEYLDIIMDIITPVCPIIDLFGVPVVNIDSPQQILPILHKLGIHADDSAEDSLVPFKGHPLIDNLISYKQLATSLKKFGPDYLNYISKATGRIHASFHQLTAPSGRMSVSKPGLQQVPAEAIYRQCFKAQKGGYIITADYGQVELRIMAKQSGDPTLIRAFNEKRDLHKHTASLVFHEPYENVDPKHRTISKKLNFGTAYGVGAESFAHQVTLEGIPLSVTAAETMLKNFWNAYGVLDGYLKRQGAIAADQGYAKTMSGRTGRFVVNLTDKQAYSSNKRLGRNFGVQGTGADIVKLALYYLRNELIKQNLWETKIVNVVHDEIVCETNDDPEVVEAAVHKSMMAAGDLFLNPVPCVVDTKVAKVWSK